MAEKTVPFRYHVGEAMVEPFWDPAVSGLKEWKIADNGAAGVKVNQYWCYVPYEWSKTAEDGTGAVIYRDYEDLCVDGYDSLILAAVVPDNGFLRLSADTELGVKSAQADGAGKKELVLSLDGAVKITRITISIGNTTRMPATGWINWLGVQNDRLLEEHLKLKAQFDEKWEGYLKDEDYEPSFRPEYGLIATEEELEVLRERYRQHLNEGGRDVFYENISTYLDMKPEEMIGDYMRLADDVRFCRQRDEGQFMAFSIAEKLVQYALLKKDKKVLRLAARYAMSLMMTENWLDGFIADYPLGIWEHSAFVPSSILSDLAAVLDGAGELLTETAKKMIRKQMMEKGLSKVNSVVWRYDSIFKCNQLAWYSYGRMSAYAVLSKEYSRIVPYMDLAAGDIADSMKQAIGTDGGADEGVSYFLYQPGNSGGGLFWYARALGKDFRDCVPGELGRTDMYIDAMSSTMEDKAFLPVCDYSEPRDIRGLAVMAYLRPDSLWVNAYHKKKEELGGMPNDFISFLLDSEIPVEDNDPKTFVRLSQSGYVSSVRSSGEGKMKVFVPGNKAGAGHNHEDKGSFLVEYNGEQFFTDPGMVSYGSAQSRSLKMCDFHNMLLPVGLAENPHPVNPLPYFFTPEGTGDESELHLSMDMTPSFDKYFSLWRRSLDSASPCELVLTDEYVLGQGSGAAVLLNTWFEPLHTADSIILQGGKSGCIIEIPEDMEAEVKKYKIRDKDLFQIRLYRQGSRGKIQLNMKFEPGIPQRPGIQGE